MGLRILPLATEDAPAFDEAFAIYRDAIVRSEQRAENELRKLAGRSDYSFLIAERERAIIGLSVSFVPLGDDFWLFEYVVVAPEERGRGGGANLFLASRLIAGQDRTALVEADGDVGGGETGEQAKRLAFYARFGFKRLSGLRYILPLDTYGAPPPMILLALAPPEAAAVEKATVKRWLRRIYAEVYGQAPDDPRIAAMLVGLPREIALDAIG